MVARNPNKTNATTIESSVSDVRSFFRFKLHQIRWRNFMGQMVLGSTRALACFGGLFRSECHDDREQRERRAELFPLQVAPDKVEEFHGANGFGEHTRPRVFWRTPRPPIETASKQRHHAEDSQPSCLARGRARR